MRVVASDARVARSLRDLDRLGLPRASRPLQERDRDRDRDRAGEVSLSCTRSLVEEQHGRSQCRVSGMETRSQSRVLYPQELHVSLLTRTL